MLWNKYIRIKKVEKYIKTINLKIFSEQLIDQMISDRLSIEKILSRRLCMRMMDR